MDPVCFYIGSKAVYWYGIMVAAGFLACVVHLTILGIREGRAPSFGSDFAFWLMLFGIIGARIAYVAANINYYWQDPLAIIRVDQGGLIYYGGFIGAFIAGVIFARIKNLSILALADYAVSALPLGHAFGRVGCFLNACCYGAVTAVPWGVAQQEAVRHPVQLYEAFLNLVIYVLLTWAYVCRNRKQNGQILAIYCILYPLGRFGLEFFRGDERLGWHDFSYAKIISLGLIAVGLVMGIILSRSRRNREP